jgi:hypothetical protein
MAAVTAAVVAVAAVVVAAATATVTAVAAMATATAGVAADDPTCDRIRDCVRAKQYRGHTIEHAT